MQQFSRIKRNIRARSALGGGRRKPPFLYPLFIVQDTSTRRAAAAAAAAALDAILASALYILPDAVSSFYFERASYQSGMTAWPVLPVASRVCVSPYWGNARGDLSSTMRRTHAFCAPRCLKRVVAYSLESRARARVYVSLHGCTPLLLLLLFFCELRCHSCFFFALVFRTFVILRTRWRIERQVSDLWDFKEKRVTEHLLALFWMFLRGSLNLLELYVYDVFTVYIYTKNTFVLYKRTILIQSKVYCPTQANYSFIYKNEPRVDQLAQWINKPIFTFIKSRTRPCARNRAYFSERYRD